MTHMPPRTYTVREFAQWQEGMADGLLAAAELLDNYGHHDQAQLMRERAIHYVTHIAEPLPIEAHL